jgi:hypothetical protein
MANFFDLDPTQTKSSDGKYIDLVFTGFIPDTDYGLTFAWVYEDPKLGISGESPVFDFTTIPEPDLAPPKFTENDLDAINSILYINWNGKDATNSDYPEGKLKQVNVWIKGGDFGEEYKQYGTSFTKAGQIQINATQKSTYCVKLQAEGTTVGKFSEFSPEFCITLLKQPKAVYDIRHEWDKTGNLTVFWKFDPTLKDGTNDNTLADSFALQLVDDANDKDGTWWTAVEKEKIPPLEQKIPISADQLKGVFGQVSAFQTNYDAFIYVRDKNLQISLVTGYQVTMYVDPLTPPVISATKGPLSYNVSFTNNSEFDRIYIEDSTNNGVTWVDRGSSSSNPAYISAGNSLSRQVRARFSKIRGGLTGYSNTVTVTPDPLVSLNDEAPNPPGAVSGTSGIDNSGSIGFNGFINFTWTPDSQSSNVRGYRIRFRPYKASAPFEEWSYVDSPGTATKYRLTGLAVGTTYEIAVGSFNEFNKESVTYTSGTNVTVSGTPFIGTNVTTSGYFGANSGNDVGEFRFGYAVEPGKRGIRFNDDNYWYIDSNASAAFKLGGDAENYIQWNGQAFIVQGDLRAKKGNFSGHVEIKSGGSLWSATGGMNANQSNITGAGYILNSTGLKFSSANTPDITTISGTTGRFVTSSAEIGGWTVDTNSIYSSNITLRSGSTPGATSIVATNSGSYVGIRPRSTAGSDIVLWAGTVQPQNLVANNAASGQAGFQVNADGQLYATGAIISGKITVESGSSLGGLLNDTSKIYYGSSTPTVPTGGHKSGDAWVDTGNNNVLKVWNTSVTPAAWTVAQDSESVKTIANLKNRTFYAAQLTSPLRPNLSETFVSGDLWLNSSNKNKPYRYDGSSWIEVSDTDAADALSKANSALSKVTDYEDRFGTGVNAGLIQDLKVNTRGTGIYSSYVENNQTYAKSSYDSTTTGFYIGWDGTAGVVYPALNIGNAAAYVKWNSRGTGTLEVKGTIKATSGSFDGNVTAGNGAITIGTGGISSSQFSINSSGQATFTSGTFSGSITATGTISGGTLSGATIINSSGTKTTTLSGGGLISMVDTGTDWGSGAAITINSKNTGYYGTEDVSLSMGGNRVSLSRSGGINPTTGLPLPSHQSYIAHADELSGVSIGTLLISTGAESNIALKPGSSSKQVQIYAKLNTLFGIMPTYIQGATTWNSTAIRNITVSSSAPSGGSEGDVWIQI